MSRRATGDRAGRFARLALVPFIGLLLAACGEQANNNPTTDGTFPSGFPHEVVTAQGAQSASLYLPVFLVAVVIFILVEGLLLLAILRYRHRGGDGELPRQVHGNSRLEIVWTAIPLVVVVVLFVASTMVLAKVEDKSEEPAVVVDVLAFRFGWTFTYPDSGVTVSSSPASPSSDQARDPAQDLVLPVGQPVLFRLNSADVIHSFYVPSFYFKRDVIPGRTNEFEVTIEKPGRYGGQCAEFCGLNHGQMFFDIRAVEPAEYEEWLAGKVAGTTPAEQASEAPAAAAADAVASAPAAATSSPAPAAMSSSPAPSAQAFILDHASIASARGTL